MTEMEKEAFDEMCDKLERFIRDTQTEIETLRKKLEEMANK